MLSSHTRVTSSPCLGRASAWPCAARRCAAGPAALHVPASTRRSGHARSRWWGWSRPPHPVQQAFVPMAMTPKACSDTKVTPKFCPVRHPVPASPASCSAGLCVAGKDNEALSVPAGEADQAAGTCSTCQICAWSCSLASVLTWRRCNENAKSAWCQHSKQQSKQSSRPVWGRGKGWKGRCLGQRWFGQMLLASRALIVLCLLQTLNTEP